MLYYLENIGNGTMIPNSVSFSGNVFYLLGKKVFLVGRKNVDFLIENDKSISKQHAVIRIEVSAHFQAIQCS